MATSGSFNTNSEGNFYFSFEWSKINDTKISYSVIAHNTPGNYRTVYLKNLQINDENNSVFYDTSGIQYQDGNVVTSGEIVTGSSFWASFWGGVGISSGHNCYGTDSWSIDPSVTIPIVSCSATQGLNTIGASLVVTNNGGASIVDNYIDLFTDSGCTNKVGIITGTTGTFTGLNPNTTYYARANASNGTHRGYSSVVTVSTYDIAKLTNFLHFNLGDSIPVTYNNPSGSAIQIALYKTDGNTALAGYRNCSGSSYIFNLTDEELDNIYKEMGVGNSLAVRCYIKTNNIYLDYAQQNCNLTGNQKTVKIGKNGVKRGKVFIGVNGTVKKAVVWTCNNGVIERSI